VRSTKTTAQMATTTTSETTRFGPRNFEAREEPPTVETALQFHCESPAQPGLEPDINPSRKRASIEGDREEPTIRAPDALPFEPMHCRAELRGGPSGCDTLHFSTSAWTQ